MTTFDDDQPVTIPQPRSLIECDRMLSDARIILEAQRTRGGVIGLARIRRTIDAILDARLRLAGPPICMSVPYGQPDPCGRVKSRFGSQVYLCPECDFRRCDNSDCDRRVLALDSVFCNVCRGLVL